MSSRTDSARRRREVVALRRTARRKARRDRRLFAWIGDDRQRIKKYILDEVAKRLRPYRNHRADMVARRQCLDAFYASLRQSPITIVCEIG